MVSRDLFPLSRHDNDRARVSQLGSAGVLLFFFVDFIFDGIMTQQATVEPHGLWGSFPCSSTLEPSS